MKVKYNDFKKWNHHILNIYYNFFLEKKNLVFKLVAVEIN